MVPNRFTQSRARLVPFGLVVLALGAARPAAAQDAASADSVYEVLARAPLDSLTASQYLWLQDERERRRKPAPAGRAPATRPFSSAWERPGPTSAPPIPERASLAGPRFGVTFLSDGIVQKLATEDIDVASLVTQFGWQVEHRFYSRQGGPMGVTEWILLVGGLEQGLVLPSLSWLVGVRTERGSEFGVGPNVTPAGGALVLAGGITIPAGALNLPVNLAVVPSKSGVRVSLLAGFNMRQ